MNETNYARKIDELKGEISVMKATITNLKKEKNLYKEKAGELITKTDLKRMIQMRNLYNELIEFSIPLLREGEE